jgi:hypothetical protein
MEPELNHSPSTQSVISRLSLEDQKTLYRPFAKGLDNNEEAAATDRKAGGMFGSAVFL